MRPLNHPGKPALYGFSVLCLSAASAWGDANQPLDRPYTLRNGAPFVLEGEYRRQIESGGERGFIYPGPCAAPDTLRVCRDSGHWTYEDADLHRRLVLSPLTALEYRRVGENSLAWELGAITSGYSGPLSFRLDARLFSEVHEDPDHASFDREFVEKQDEEASGSIAYSSYSRYRSELSYDWTWGKLTAARDAVHWGPGLFQNLVFHQDAVPFNHIVFTSRLGPVRIASLYGQLSIDGDGAFRKDTNSRSIYAHRYEWVPGGRITLGLSEQLILYNGEDAFAFIPLIPLFMAKGTQRESANNGNLSFDAAYRFSGIASIYSEFLIDDMQSPATLFDDTYGNKWGWMAGAHFIHGFGPVDGGLILEYSRIEPWVYTHYKANTSQAANAGYPIGNQNGPNSQAITAKVYGRSGPVWYVGATLDAIWRGVDPGSAVGDVPDSLQDRPKRFLLGISSPEIAFTPYVFKAFGLAYIEGRFEIRSRPRAWARIGFRY